MSGTLTRKLLRTLVFSTLVSVSAFSQVPALSNLPQDQNGSSPEQHDTQHGQSMGEMQMQQSMALQLPSPHESSGTSWQPASVRGHEWMWRRGQWDLMAHGIVFLTYNQQGGPRGGGQSRVGELADVHGAAQTRQGHAPVAADVFGGIADVAAPGISRTLSDGRNLPRAAAGRSSASAQRVCRAGRAYTRCR